MLLEPLHSLLLRCWYARTLERLAFGSWLHIVLWETLCGSVYLQREGMREPPNFQVLVPSIGGQHVVPSQKSAEP